MVTGVADRRGPAKAAALLYEETPSSREERDLAQSYALGANAYVVKPVEFHQFITAVKELGIFWGVINEPPPEGSDPIK